MDTSVRIKFWGTRGLFSSPRYETAKYGGNTTCIQVLYKNHLIIVDTGFGASNLGESLMERILQNQEKLQIHIFYTHFHWDHIQGLPFFHPIYFPTSTLNIYSPLKTSFTKENLDILFDGSYSPFAGIDSMPSSIDFHQLGDNGVNIDGLQIQSMQLDHCQSDDRPKKTCHTFAYRFIHAECKTKVIIATDHEARPSQTNDKLIEFSKDANLLIHDGQYTNAEYRHREGWGHSTISQALDNALAAKAQHTLLTHHDPRRDDSEIEGLYEQYEREKKYADLNFNFAKEGIVYNPKSLDKK